MDDRHHALDAATRQVFTGITRYTWIAFVALLAISAAELAVFASHRQSRTFALRSRDAVRLARTAELAAADRDANLRLYLLSHQKALLAREDTDRITLQSSLDSLELMTAGQTAQQRRVRDIARSLAAWESGFAEPVRTGQPLNAAASTVLFQPVRQRLADLVAIEEEAFDVHVLRDESSAGMGAAIMLLPLLALAIIVVALGRNVRAQALELLDQHQQVRLQSGELETQVARLKKANREQAFAVAAAEDAREQARHDALERSRATAMLDAALASAPMGFAFVDRNQRYVTVNRALAALRGVNPESLMGCAVADALPPELATAVSEQIAEVLETLRPHLNVRVESPPVGGHRLSWIVSCYPVLASGDDLRGVGVMIVDITDRAELEEQIRQSQKMEAVGRLAGGVAHDFNNLLTVIRSYGDLVLLETAESDPRHEDLLEIRSAADRAATLARQLLAFSRKQVLIPKILDLNEIVTGLESMVSRLLPEAVRRELRLGTDLYRIKVDPGHMEQVLLNLVINAADAMPKGGQLTVATTNIVLDAEEAARAPDAAAGEYVLVSVSDTGTGMDDATLHRIFEPFFTTKPTGKGTGLGLSTVYGIVKQAGGFIRVTSVVGQGTTFRVYFPRTRDLPARPARSREPGAPVEYATVLIVEDETGVRSTLSRILQRTGYATLEAAHGGAAMRLAKEHPQRIDLVISDLMMPGMNGQEFIERFSGLHPESQVLFMSGFTDDEVLSKGLSKQKNFIEKPFTVEQITSKVRDALERT
ncbi:MAG: ATP-binding protein [Gemmatimonadetes bacterium]|nr:ATP-binding protein [Gemmatimonadota bacterium]